ncbi:GENERAL TRANSCRIPTION FACTOR 3C POLYPEPTIDE 1 [Phytophthora cinnamomi]|uniref:GENERAL TRANSCRIPTION FACTOR 3C POLYPEPTIDE 1 n=1 Tax=Phytophthora cinnamomi TaxID=4785 RepID=UPI003559AB13|nr:GENERAL TRANSCRIPTION FACTOR 3C POLYPEPTIDE 1 [Phytophthora cinnamomi]
MATRVRPPRELVAACMDYIALEGSAGLSVASLFSSVEPSEDVQVRRQVWRLLRSSHGVLRFFRGSAAPASAAEATSKKRKRTGPALNEENSVEVKRELLEATAGAQVGGRTALTPEELAIMTYEEAVKQQPEQNQNQEQVVVAACEELRHRALNIPVKAIAADLGDEHLRILEAVGNARVHGVTVTTLTKLGGGTVKRLHNCLDTLISYGLVVKRMMIVARPAMRRLNIIHLPRFAAEFKPQMFDESADFESDDQSKKILCAAAETYLKGLPTHSSVLSDMGRDLSLHKRHLEVLRSHIMQECKVDENFPLELFQAVLQPSRRASLEPKILNCVRYKPPNARKNSNYRRARTGFGLVAIARKLGKRKIDVKKRLKEKLTEPVVKLLFENAKREAELSDNPGGLFDEEVAVQASTRLTALFRRAVMMIVSPREEYHPLVAEELISFWTPHEIRLVWRYLWLKNWIVRASEKERGRGYCTSQRLQDSLKVTTLSYPLLLFQQAAEQESMVTSTLEEISTGRPESIETRQRSASFGGIGDDLREAMRMHVAVCLDSLVDQGVLICVNAYYDQRYIVKEHGDVWMLRPFSLVPSTSSLSTPQVVFEGEKDTLSFPWLKMDGGTNYKFLFAIQRKLLSLILQAPGMTEKRAHARMNKLLSLQDTREAMSLLVEEGLVYARAVTLPAAKATSLFEMSAQPSAPNVVKLIGSVLAYDRSMFEVHYFPHIECIQRFGSIVQDYQNEVFPND